MSIPVEEVIKVSSVLNFHDNSYHLATQQILRKTILKNKEFSIFAVFFSLSSSLIKGQTVSHPSPAPFTFSGLMHLQTVQRELKHV